MLPRCPAVRLPPRTTAVLFTSPRLPTNSAAFWFMMQIGMITGLITSYPMNRWLILHGIKEVM